MPDELGLTNTLTGIYAGFLTMLKYFFLLLIAAAAGVVGYKLGKVKNKVFIFESIGENGFMMRQDWQVRKGRKYEKELILAKSKQDICDFDEKEIKVFNKKGKRIRFLLKYENEYFPMTSNMADAIFGGELELKVIPSNLVAHRMNKIKEFANRYKPQDKWKKILEIALPIAFGILIVAFMAIYKESIDKGLDVLQEAIQLGGEIAKNRMLALPAPTPPLG